MNPSSKQLKELATQAQLIVKNCKEQPDQLQQKNCWWFYIKKAIMHLLCEKENLLFALLQWAVIGVAYYLFVLSFDWIPPEIWEAAGKDSDTVPVTISVVLLLWGGTCIALAAYPIGLLTGCMSASAILKAEGKDSTIADCLKMTVPYSWIIWPFSWFDSWLTAKRILDRLPKKNNRTPASIRAAKEALYQAWKLCSLGFLPSVLYGKSFIQAGTESLKFLKNRFWLLSKLRLIHVVICWVIGVSCYVGLVFFMCYLGATGHDLRAGNFVYNVYAIACLPLLVALALLLVVFRPIYITAATYIFIDYAQETALPRLLPKPSSKAVSALVVFLLLCLVIAVIILYRDQLGITALFNGTHTWSWLD